jgi:iron-sulfur cluster assembly protein
MSDVSPSPPSKPNVLTITDAAANHIRALMQARATPAKGVRISLKTKGCSGMAYSLEYVDVVKSGDEHVCDKDVNVYIDPQAVLFLIGTHMDFDDDPLQPGFKFINPNEKGRCGCGQSFHV